MIKNYFKIAFRNLARHKGFTAIIIGGLAIGMACCLLIFVYIQDELSYDRFHSNSEQIYRVTFSTNDEGTPTNANGSFGVGPALKKDFPEVQKFTRLRKAGNRGTKSLVRYGDKSFYEKRFFFADSTVFDVFSFPLLKGNPETALARPNTVVITQQMARKYFPNENPVGKTLITDPFGEGELMELEITGIMKNIPRNSHVHFDFLASLSSTSDNPDQFGGFQSVYTYLVLEERASERALEEKLLNFLHRNWTDDPWYTIQLQPLVDIHLYSQLRSEIEANGNIRYVYIFGVIALVILLIACINFMNLVTARSVNRAKEVGVRKAVGAGKSQLIHQFLTESVVLSLISGVVAVLLVDWLTPVFNKIAGKQIDILAYFGPWFVIGLIGLIIIVGLVAGFYPAFILSRFRPVNTLKGKLIDGGSGSFLRKGLVVFQFTVSMALIAVTGVIYNQLNYIQTKDLGYAGDQIMVLPLNNEVRDHYEAFRNELLGNSNILNTATSSLVPTMGSSHNIYQMQGSDTEQSLATYFTSKHFLETYSLKLLAGNNIKNGIESETGGDFLISKKAVKALGLNSVQEAIGRGVTFIGEYDGRITGVVNDMHIYSLHENMYSSAFFITPIKYHKYLSIRLNPLDVSGSVGRVQRLWEQMFPGYPLDYFFLDESFEHMHRADIRLAETITWFALLAIFVACLGLFGLSAYAAEQRIKEVGVRKVLGASISSIVILFSKDFMRLVIIGMAIAVPMAYYFASNWLESFAYKIDIGIQPFVLAGCVLILIALATISYNSIKTALKNPVESLRSE